MHTRIARSILPMAALLSASLLAPSPAAHAQGRTSTVVRVQVTDSTGTPVNGADVSLIAGLNNVLGRGITDDAGRQVLVASLDSGDYQVVVRRLGFQRAERFF